MHAPAFARLLLLAGAAAAMAIPAAATAQTTSQEQLTAQIEKVRATFASRGYAPDGEPQMRRLAPGATERIAVTLVAGKRYQILGLCDNACKDIDLWLLDPAGTVVDKDVANDDYPLVAAGPNSTARYMVEVKMNACTAPTCGYALQVYSK
jgi:hypothetical protein